MTHIRDFSSKIARNTNGSRPRFGDGSSACSAAAASSAPTTEARTRHGMRRMRLMFTPSDKRTGKLWQVRTLLLPSYVRDHRPADNRGPEFEWTLLAMVADWIYRNLDLVTFGAALLAG